MNSIRVLSPATTANLGPGFDCLGMSLDLWNSLEVIPGEPAGSAPLVEIIGEGEGELAADRSNLVYRAMEFLFREADENLPGVEGDGDERVSADNASLKSAVFELYRYEPVRDSARGGENGIVSVCSSPVDQRRHDIAGRLRIRHAPPVHQTTVSRDAAVVACRKTLGEQDPLEGRRSGGVDSRIVGR